MRSDIQSAFTAEMDRLYTRYLKHCRDTGIRPLGKVAFAAGIAKEVEAYQAKLMEEAE